MVLISIPTLGLLFLQNKQVQTTVFEKLTSQLAENIQTEITASSVHYSFFKRMQINDLYVADRSGDTLIYAEVCNLQLKKFRPDKKIIQFRKLSFDNALLQVTMDEERNSSLQFFIDSLRRDLPPEEKTVVSIRKMDFFNSRFRRIDPGADPPPYGIDLKNMDVRSLNIEIRDFTTRMDTTTLKVAEATGRDVSGFDLQKVTFDLKIGKKFMTFSEGLIKTPLSDAAIERIDFRFNNPRHFKYFYDSIKIDLSTYGSNLDFHDIAQFFPQTKKLNGTVELNGNLYGRFGDLYGRNIVVNYLDSTRLSFDMELRGMPSKDSLFMDFSFRECTTVPSEVRNLTRNYAIEFLEDTMQLRGIETLTYQGNFRGYYTDFETAGSFFTNLGDIHIDLNMQPDTTKMLVVQGNIASDHFDLGRLLSYESEIGAVDFNVDLDGVNNDGDLSAIISGTVDTIGLFGYDYSNIQLEGMFTNRKFDGSFFIKDPNIDLMFSGRIDLEDRLPAFDFILDVHHLRPYHLNLRDDDPEYFASFLLKTDMTGNNIDNLNGNIKLVNSTFRREGNEARLEDMLLTARNTADTSLLQLRSDPLDAEIGGKYRIRELPNIFTGIFNRHFNVLSENLSWTDTATSFTFNAEFKDTEQWLDFFFPRFSAVPGITLEGSLLPVENDYHFAFNGSFPRIGFNGLSSENLLFNVNADSSSLNLQIKGDRLASAGSLKIEKPEIQVAFQNDRNELNISWNNATDPLYSGLLSAEGALSADSMENMLYTLTIHPSEFYYDNRRFEIPQSALTISSGGIVLDSIAIKGTDQYLLASGHYSGKAADSVTVAMQNFNLNMINEVLKNSPVVLAGLLSGETTLKTASGNPVIISSMLASGVHINDQQFGDLTIFADWLRTDQELQLGIHSSDTASTNKMKIDGLYKPKGNLVDLDVHLSSIEISTFQRYMDHIFEEVGGTGNIDLSINGTTQAPKINGTITLENSSALLRQTQTRYYCSDTISVADNDIYLDRFEIVDAYGDNLFAEGVIRTDDFSGLAVDLNLNAENFNFLSTTRFDNEQFYGDIFASGLIQVKGPADQLKIRATATTEKQTNLKLPLYNATKIQTTDFITFTQSDTTSQPELPEVTQQKSKYQLDLELDITSNTTVQLIFDPKVGDIIEASGNGTLKFEIDENGNFSMFGNVMIQDGEYLFTLQNVINKRFRVKPGGSISWNGPPRSAIIDLEAVYETKASTYNLSPEPTEEMKKRIPVHCLLSLEGELSNPAITPQINLPTAEPETRSLLNTSIGTDEDLMRQFISLLVINNFISSTEFGLNTLGGSSIGVAGVTASELLSNQLSNWLSQISSDFDIGVNYRPGDAISSDEVEVALSTQLLNDRIIFSGNLDVMADEVKTSTGEASNIVGDFDLEFRVSDKISLKAFNRVNDDRIVRPSLYTQGVGLIYRSEFNSIADFFKRNDKGADDKNGEQSQNNDALKREEE